MEKKKCMEYLIGVRFSMEDWKSSSVIIG
jgi:hypothetical protein